MKCTTQESAVFVIRSKVREFPSSDRSIELAPIFSYCITWFPKAVLHLECLSAQMLQWCDEKL